MQDKAHFFVTYEAKRFDLPVTIAPEGSVTNRVGLLPADAAAQLGPASQPFQQDLIFAKIDVEPTDNDRIELTFQTAMRPSSSSAGRPRRRTARRPRTPTVVTRCAGTTAGSGSTTN